jgi:hypothetical protein
VLTYTYIYMYHPTRPSSTLDSNPLVEKIATCIAQHSTGSAFATPRSPCKQWEQNPNASLDALLCISRKFDPNQSSTTMVMTTPTLSHPSQSLLFHLGIPNILLLALKLCHSLRGKNCFCGQSGLTKVDNRSNGVVPMELAFHEDTNRFSHARPR